MELNPIWLADASFFLNSALLGALCGFMYRSIMRRFGVVVGAVVMGFALSGIILMTSSARGVVHDALVLEAHVQDALAQDKPVSQPSKDTVSSWQFETSRF